jgi:hypothetical protein
VEPSSEELNVINADDLGSFQIKVMLQGDCNAPATMMRCMNTILGEFIGKFVWVYSDDILIFSDTYEDHLDHLKQVFHKLAKAHFFLKMEKCQFLTSELRLLGHIITDHSIYPETERLRKIEDWRTPNNKKQLQSFLGVINYIAPHLFHTSTVLAPLTVMNPSPPGLRLTVERLSIEVDRASWMAIMVTTISVLLVLGWLLAFR